MKITKEFDINESQKISIPLWVSDDKKEWVSRDIIRIYKSMGYPYLSTLGRKYMYASVEKPEIYLTREEIQEWAENHKFGYAIRSLNSEWISPESDIYHGHITNYRWCRIYLDHNGYLKFGESHKFTKEDIEND